MEYFSGLTAGLLAGLIAGFSLAILLIADPTSDEEQK